jgi:hypothetical protein
MLVKELKNLHSLLILGWLSILISVLFIGWTSTWSSLGVLTIWPPFADMRSVQGSLTSLELGLNPQIDNQGALSKTVMNYPLVWSWIAEILNLQNETNYLILILIWIIFFIFCCHSLLRMSPSLFLLLLCFSGSALLVVERGNNDLIVFVLLFLAARSNAIFSTIFLTVATLLKIYPLLIIPAFLRNFKTFIAMIVGAVLILLLLWSELSSIRSGTPVSAVLSYGSISIVASVQKFISLVYGSQSIPVPAQKYILFSSTILSLTFLATSLVIFMKQKTRKLLATTSLTTEEEKLFLVGSCVYIGTFILSSNWDYRLIFLLFCVPLVLKLEYKIFRYFICVTLLIATNQILMYSLLSELGMALNILSKILLLVVFCSITLMKIRQILESKSLVIKKKKLTNLN